MVYHALAFVVGAVAALVVLYTVGDWLLLGLGLITLLALLLAAKNGLPHYYTQARLILNLGEVREGERIVLNGLPWQVRSLNMVAELVNPALRHGVLRVPTADLTKLSSRPVEHGDLWFPCREEDWVLLADGTFGKVVMVTSEFVQVVQSVVLIEPMPPVPSSVIKSGELRGWLPGDGDYQGASRSSKTGDQGDP